MRLLPYRFRLSLLWLLDRLGGGAAHVPAGDIAVLLTQLPMRWRGLPYIESIKPAPGPGHFLEIRLVGYPDPFHWPAEIETENLSEIVAEQLKPGHWHRYVTEETPLGPSDVVADCGAAEGLFGILHGRRCARMAIFEPNRRFVDACGRTFAGFPNVEIFPCALGAAPGKAFFSDHGTASRLQEAKEGEPGGEVDVRTLDDVVASTDLPVTFIKADLEGHELDFLAGAKETLSRLQPKIAITTYHDPSHARKIEALLKSLCPDYRFRRKGYVGKDWPVMLHAWV